MRQEETGDERKGLGEKNIKQQKIKDGRKAGLCLGNVVI